MATSYRSDRQVHDSARGFDELSGTGDSVFSSNKGKAGFGRRGYERVPVVGDGFEPSTNQLALDVFDQTLMVDTIISRGQHLETSQRPLPDHHTLADTLRRVVIGGSSFMQEASRLGAPWTIGDIQAWVNGVGTMVGQVRKGQAKAVTHTDAPSLLDMGSWEPAVTVRNDLGRAGAHLLDVDLDEVSWAWLGRERARRAQERRDPQWEHLLLLRYLLHYNAPLEEYNLPDQFDGWGIGMGATLGVLREEVAIAQKVWNDFLPGVTSGEIRAHRLEIIGAISLWYPQVTSMGHRLSLIDSDLARFVTLIPAPPAEVHELSEVALGAICRRRGWLLSDVEQDTHIERALRGIRNVAHVAEAVRDLAKACQITETELRHDPAVALGEPDALAEVARRAGVDHDEAFTANSVCALFDVIADRESISDTAVDHWVCDGDPRLLVQLMEAQKSRERRTQWLLKVKDNNDVAATDNMDAVARAAYFGLGGVEYQPRSFEESVFWSNPEAVLKPATKLAQDI